MGWLGLAVFLSAVTALPFAHLYHHVDDHQHDEASPEAFRQLRARAHRHADGLVHAHAPGLSATSGSSPEASVASPGPGNPAHGHGAVQHFGIGVLASATFVLPPPARPSTRTVSLATPKAAPALALPGARLTRGPPSIAAAI